MSKRYYKNSLKFKVLEYIEQMSDTVILRKDVENMGSARQISRCLKSLEEMGKLAKIGYGVYAKSYISERLNLPVIAGGFDRACKTALTKLGVEWELGSAAKAYNAGLSTQVPVRTIVCLKERFRGNLIYGNSKLIIEKGINAR